MSVNLAFGKVLSDLRTNGGKCDISECSNEACVCEEGPSDIGITYTNYYTINNFLQNIILINPTIGL